MTASVVSPVIFPAVPAGRHGPASTVARSRGPLPLPRLVSPLDRSMLYGVATIDCNGRIADRMLITALGWAPGTRLHIREREGVVLVESNAHGVFVMTTHVRLPAPVRHLCRLAPGDRVLLIAQPDLGRLVVHPPERPAPLGRRRRTPHPLCDTLAWTASASGWPRSVRMSRASCQAARAAS